MVETSNLLDDYDIQDNRECIDYTPEELLDKMVAMLDTINATREISNLIFRGYTYDEIVEHYKIKKEKDTVEDVKVNGSIRVKELNKKYNLR